MSSPSSTFAGDVVVERISGDAAQRDSTSTATKPSFTVDRAGLQITGYDQNTMQPHPGWSTPVGTAYTVTYAFRASAPTQMPSDTGGFQRFNTQQIIQAEKAMQGWADAARITFTRVGAGTSGEGAYSNNATILIGNYSTGEANAAAFSYFPGNTAASSSAGDIWININASSNASPLMGNYGAQVLIHELGHAIGLVHPGEYDAHDDLPFSYANDAEYVQDSRQYTVMSYFSETNTGGAFGGRYSSAPLLDDIRAIQYEYGANMSTRTGDTVYGFNSNADREWFIATSSGAKLIFAVWDAGGVDTFDFSGFSQDQVIDLREGYFSSVGGMVSNVAVAEGVKIENAIGGPGSDTITGSAVDNRLQGGDGNDQIYAGSGNDTINGNVGNDTIQAYSGSNYLRGDEGNDCITGGRGFDDINGNAGNDIIVGGLGDDWVVGGKDNDYVFGDDGNDLVYGNLGDDTCIGGNGNDTVRGGQGNDTLTGGAGNDFVSGDRGDDTMSGGAGADIFHSSADAGIDRVLDFNRADGDRVQLDPGTPYSVAQVGDDIVITLGSSADKMILVGVQMSSLTPGWIFGA